MDRTVPYRRLPRPLAALLLAMLLFAGPWPIPRARAALPILSDEPAGDPGDGVLRPADISPSPYTPSPSSTVTTTGTTSTTSTTSTTAVAPAHSNTVGGWLLVPCLNPAGQPWLTFRLVRIDQVGGTVAFGGAGASSLAGRWHRAP